VEFDLRQLDAFVNVVDSGGFGAASRVLHLSQAAVSERIANLESAIDMRLLDRQSRKIQPTAVGRRFYTLAKQLLEQREAIYLELAELAGVVRGTLNIGASTIPGEYLLPQLLPEFLSNHPQVELNILVSDSAGVMMQVREGEVDLGVVGARPADKQLHCETLWGDRLLLVVPAGHRFAGRKQIRPEEIAEDPFIMRERGSGSRKLMEEVLAGHGIELLPVAITLGSTTAVKEAVSAGLGITLLSERAVRREVAAGILAAIPIEGLNFERNFLLVTDRKRTQSPLCKRFIQHLRRCHRANQA
jgi:DNA-binding transcriptional LysR family regulator